VSASTLIGSLGATLLAIAIAHPTTAPAAHSRPADPLAAVTSAVAQTTVDSIRVQLRNVADAAGLHFVHQHSPSPQKYYIESAPGGIAVFDYNNDGRPDMFFTNGAPTPGLEKTSPAYSNRLYRNDGGMRFTDVTDVAGTKGVGYAMGAAAADYDNDGNVDLFVAGVRTNQLLRNRGDGTFEDVTVRTGIVSGDWAVAAGWFDYDGDALLDLLVVNYVQWSPETNRYCGDQTRGLRIYCHPRFFAGLPNRLYRNRGDGRFEDVSAGAGLLAHVGKGMSVAFADYDRDGRLDVFVTNDTVPNFLFRNAGDGTFRETALLAGVSVPASGRPVSGMGVDFQDYDNDGWEDISFTALSGETFPLFRNERSGSFVETTQSSGLATLTMKSSGWCSILADVDNDGDKDLFTANSHANDRIAESETLGWKQHNSLFVNNGDGRFRDATAEAGLDRAVEVHRGCGVADFTGDGRLDLAVLVLGARAELWQNETTPDRHWLIVRLVGTKSNRDGIGARVIVGNQVRTMTTAAGYASSSHAGVHFGVGTATEIERIEVLWPSGTRQIVEKVKTNQVVEVKEPGSGLKAPGLRQERRALSHSMSLEP
jgi:enediyne biosynthesis protein E4